jgi:polyisoprenoid-binding protein YceI
VTWKAKKVTGEHWGYLNFSGATWEVLSNQLVSGSFDIDMNSMTVEDLDPIKDAKNNKRLLSHLKNDDFFATQLFPKAHFEIISAIKIASVKSNENEYQIKGAMTIKSNTKPVDFKASFKKIDGATVFEGGMDLDRTLWNIRYRSAQFFEGLGDNLIYDLFNIKFKVIALTN